VKLAALALVALGLTALGCETGGGIPGEAMGDPITEHLVMAPYPAATAWKQVSDRHTRSGATTVWVPADQEPKSARDRLTRQVMFGRGKTAPAELASELAAEIAEACEGARTDGPRRRTEDGNEVAYAEVTCSLGQGAKQDSLVLLKVIAGHEASYAAEREFRHLPSAAELRVANGYLAEQVFLCPVTGRTGRCAHPPAEIE
jgi:hypothetical protein